jgi:hypothetical protein
MTEDEIRAELRLYVAEFFAANVFALFCLTANPMHPLGEFGRVKKQMIDGREKADFSRC